MRTEPIPEDMVEQAEEYRNILVEAVAENDEELMEKYLEGEEITREELKKAIRKETIANTLVPVVCGSSYKNRGVQKLLDAIVDYMPAPTDVPDIKGTDLQLRVRVRKSVQRSATIVNSLWVRTTLRLCLARH